jgi:hypothetical protein
MISELIASRVADLVDFLVPAFFELLDAFFELFDDFFELDDFLTLDDFFELDDFLTLDDELLSAAFLSVDCSGESAAPINIRTTVIAVKTSVFFLVAKPVTPLRFDLRQLTAKTIVMIKKIKNNIEIKPNMIISSKDFQSLVSLDFGQ